MKRALALLFALGLWLGTALPLPAMAQSQPQFPALTGRVVDAADILTPEQEAQLTQKLQSLESQTTDQLVVATIPSLEGYDIADYGYRLGRQWGIGQGQQNNGVLLLIAPNDRLVRIEVGYGLEGVITDAYSSYIIRNDILPAFREGDFYGGINRGSDAIITQLTLDPEEAKARAADTVANQGEDNGVKIIGIIFLVLGLITAAGAVVGAAAGGRGRRVSGAVDGAGVVLWTTAQILSALASSSSGGGGGGSRGGGGFRGGGGGFGGGGASGGW